MPPSGVKPRGGRADGHAVGITRLLKWMRDDSSMEKRGALVGGTACTIALVTFQLVPLPVVARVAVALLVGGAVDIAFTHYVLTGPYKRQVAAQVAASAERRQRMQQDARRQEFEARLHRALELSDHETEAVAVVNRAFATLAGDTPAELLLADASYAHIRQAACHPDDGGPGCGVPSPGACAAVRRGQTSVFGSGEDLDACPHLRARESGDRSAACVPVTILGATVGVLHATGAPGAPPSADVVSGLEAMANQIGARLGMIRALARSDLQASTDPLTGLLNRRSLETKLRQVVDEGHGYSLLMADLDHFKLLNDTYGHDAGDKALRLFATVLSQSLRSTDLACRYGGEEFVVVLPDYRADDACAVAERLREGLMLACMSGDSPSFTASFGVAEGRPGLPFDELLTAADAALLEAKRTGRDRVVLAGVTPA